MEITAKLEGLHFFQFSMGSYSDYSVGGIYVTDHEVTEIEWDLHYKEFSNWHSNKRAEMITETYHSNAELCRQQSIAFSDYIRGCETPENSFIKLHNMVAVDSKEFWRDY